MKGDHGPTYIHTCTSDIPLAKKSKQHINIAVIVCKNVHVRSSVVLSVQVCV